MKTAILLGISLATIAFAMQTNHRLNTQLNEQENSIKQILATQEENYSYALAQLRQETAQQLHEISYTDPVKKTEILYLAATLYGEARSLPEKEIRLVADVILNRGDNILATVLKPKAFSCWNRNDPNYNKVQAFLTKPKTKFLAIAQQAIEEGPRTPYKWYHTDDIKPYWSNNKGIDHGAHIFYASLDSD